MATSGSTDFSLITSEIIEEAYRILGILGRGRQLSNEEADNGRRALNLMVKTLGASGKLWLRSETSLTLVDATASYALPSGVGTVTNVRRRTSNIDTPLIEIGREEYYDLPNKTGTGMPVNWYADYQRATTTLYVWLVPDATIAASTTLRYTYNRVIEDFDSVANDADVPQEWLEPLIYGLADRLALRFGIAADIRQEVALRAAALLNELSAADEDMTSTFFGVGR